MDPATFILTALGVLSPWAILWLERRRRRPPEVCIVVIPITVVTVLRSTPSPEQEPSAQGSHPRG